MPRTIDPETGEVLDDDRTVEDVAEFGQRIIEGSNGQLSWDTGYSLTTSTLKLKAPKAQSIEGQFDQDERVALRVEGQIDVILQPIKDKHGTVLGFERVHVVVIDRVTSEEE
jgi:hypothetical protein